MNYKRYKSKLLIFILLLSTFGYGQSLSVWYQETIVKKAFKNYTPRNKGNSTYFHSFCRHFELEVVIYTINISPQKSIEATLNDLQM